MDAFDTIIRNGFVVDGTGAAAFFGDVGVRDGKIAAIGALRNARAKFEIDATGKIVAPGHITTHSHYDAALFWDPYCSNSGENGVTTVTNSNCGFGIAPVKRRDLERTMLMLETTEQIPVRHQRAAIPWSWETFPEYLERLKALPKGVNVLTYLPINPVLVYVMGVQGAKTRRPTGDEMKQIHRLITEAMDAGAIGISMSIMGAEGNSHVDFDGTPMPTDLMDHDVAVEIGRAVAERGEGIIQMLSQIAFYGDRSVTERMAEMAHGTGARVLHNILFTSDFLPDLIDQDLVWLDGLRARGLDVTAGALITRGWVEAGIKDLDTAAGQMPAVREIIGCKSDEDVLRLIQDSSFIARFADQYSETGPANGAAGLEKQVVIDIGENPQLSGYLNRTLADIASQEGKSVVETLLDLGVKSALALQMKSAPVGATHPDQGLKLMANAGVSLGVSDGGAHTKAFGFGHYATELLIWLVRQHRHVTLEEMHFQLSLKPAQTMCLRDRGALLLGYAADILVYDLDALYVDDSRMEIVHDMPDGDWRRRIRAGGYAWTLVNGVVTHRNDGSTGDTPGKLLRITQDLRSDIPIAAE